MRFSAGYHVSSDRGYNAAFKMEQQVVQVLRAIRGPPVLKGDCDVIEEAIARSGNRYQGANDSASVV